MGLYDDLKCRYKGVADLQYQTKDTFAQGLELYKIDQDGLLWHAYQDYEFEFDYARKGIEALTGLLEPPFCEWRQEIDFIGEIKFYADDEQNGWYEYSAYFIQGTMVILTQISPEFKIIKGVLR